MVRDVRTAPRGLLAPLSQAALGALRDLFEGVRPDLPDSCRVRLLDLGLVELRDDGLAVTPLGRERLVSDR